MTAKYKNTYVKSYTQENLENSMRELISFGFSVADLIKLHIFIINCGNYNWNDPEIMDELNKLSLEKEFEDSLTMNDIRKIDACYSNFCAYLNSSILLLLKEKKLYTKVLCLAELEGSYIDPHGIPDTYYEIALLGYEKLFVTLCKGENRGKIRLQVHFDNGEQNFYSNLRWYLCNNILKDSIGKAKLKVQRTTPEFLSKTIDNKEVLVSQVDSMTNEWENPVEEEYMSLAKNTTKTTNNSYSMVNAKRLTDIFNRYKRKPVGGFISFKILLGEYRPLEVTNTLRSTKDFNEEYLKLIPRLEKEYDTKLPYVYANINKISTNATRYLSSLRNTDERTARNRIDKLASSVRNELFEVSSLTCAVSEHVKGKYFIL